MDYDLDVLKGLLTKQNPIAIVGASNNPQKYGNIIYRDMREAGYNVYPVNPKETEIEGDRCYDDLASLPQKPVIVNLVVPPPVTEKVVQRCKELEIDNIWMQPGSESPEAIRFCEENKMLALYEICIMVVRRNFEASAP